MTAVPALTATATEFNTESNYDYITIGSTLYSGTAGPTNVYMAAGDTIFWASDGSVTRGGWTICADPAFIPVCSRALTAGNICRADSSQTCGTSNSTLNCGSATIYYLAYTLLNASPPKAPPASPPPPTPLGAAVHPAAGAADGAAAVHTAVGATALVVRCRPVVLTLPHGGRVPAGLGDCVNHLHPGPARVPPRRQQPVVRH